MDESLRLDDEATTGGKDEARMKQDDEPNDCQWYDKAFCIMVDS